MAHQVHTIPWHSLASNLQYTKKHSLQQRLGEIVPLDKAGQARQLEHFCRVFQKTIRDYAEVERRRYKPKEWYGRRAAGWITSTELEDNWETNVVRAHLEMKPETRKVFDDELKPRYQTNKSWDFLKGEFQSIDNWFPDNSKPTAWSMQRDRRALGWADVINVLFMEGSFVTQALPNRQRGDEQAQHIETLLLLANHPKIVLHGLTFASEACCNTSCGVSNLSEKAVKAYIYLNVLFAMREDGSDVCSSTTDAERPEVNEVKWCYANKKSISPKAKYMNTRSWGRLMYELTRNHENHPEIAMYAPFFFPKPEEGGDMPTECDVMADAELTREFVRDLWKLMVHHEVVWTEMGQEVDWEYMCVQALDELYSLGTKDEARLFGMQALDWRDKRDGTPWNDN